MSWSPSTAPPQGHHRPLQGRRSGYQAHRSPPKGSTSPWRGLRLARQRRSRPPTSGSSQFQAQPRGSRPSAAHRRTLGRPDHARGGPGHAPREPGHALSRASPWFGAAHPAPSVAERPPRHPDLPSSLGPRASPRLPASALVPSQPRPKGRGSTGRSQHPSRTAHLAPS